MRRRKSVWVFGTLVAAIVVLMQFCTPPSEQSTSLYLNHSDTAQYVGMKACAQCHLDKVETFLHTGMGMSFDTASHQKSSANLHSNHVLYDSINNFYYYPFWRDNELFVSEFRLRDGDTLYQRIEKISYIIGSGQHTNSHLIQKGDYVVQAPFTWYAQEEKLDFPPGFENGANSRFSRVIDQECMSCHNGLPTMKPGSTSAFHSIPRGIDCERCHGPGSIHIAQRLAGKDVTGPIDYSIVNPSKLPWKRQIDVCQRCHLQGNNVLKEGKTFNDFKPGMVLSDVFEVFLPRYSNDEQLFNMANHSDRFQHSQCFIEANKNEESFTCISCHNPHVSVTKTSVQQYNSTCQSCHQTPTSTCTEASDVRALKSDNCVACHMPKSGTEDIPHVTVHDHKIGIYKDTKKASNKGEVMGLYSVNNPNPTNKTLIEAYLTYYEKFDPLPIYQQKAEDLLKKEQDDELLIHLYYQKQDWSSITSLSKSSKQANNWKGITCYRIGKAFGSLNDVTSAVNWLQLAVVKQPTEFAYKSELGSQLIKANRLQEAEDILLKAITQYDNYVPSYNNLGYAYILMGQYAKAKAMLSRAMTLDPDNLRGKENLVLLFNQLNDADNERKWLKLILEQDPRHDIALKRYSQLQETK